jgi:hypothetical protein
LHLEDEEEKRARTVTPGPPVPQLGFREALRSGNSPKLALVFGLLELEPNVHNF